MTQKKRLVRLVVTPCKVNSDIKKRTLNLIQKDEQYFVEEIMHQYDLRKKREIRLPTAEVKKSLDALKKARIPGFPVSPNVLDGEYVELTVYGDFSTLSLGWWTIPPEGAKGIDDFVQWLNGCCQKEWNDNDPSFIK